MFRVSIVELHRCVYSCQYSFRRTLKLCAFHCAWNFMCKEKDRHSLFPSWDAGEQAVPGLCGSALLWKTRALLPFQFAVLSMLALGLHAHCCLINMAVLMLFSWQLSRGPTIKSMSYRVILGLDSGLSTYWLCDLWHAFNFPEPQLPISNVKIIKPAP